MSSNHPEFSVVALIDSKDTDRANFGSAFLICQDKQATYWLTCAHVITDVGGSEKTLVDGFSIKLVAPGEEQLATVRSGRDLAIVRVEGFLDKEPLKLCEAASKGKRFVIVGYSQKDKARFITQISGCLGKSTEINLKGNRTPAWYLEIDGSTKDILQPGYSGSPVIDQDTGYVIGVVTQREGEKQGIAIAIESLKEISGDLSINILKADTLQNREISGESANQSEQIIRNKLEQLRAEKNSAELRIKQLTVAIREIETQLINGKDQQFKEALSWLEKRSKLAKQYGEYSLKNLTEFPDIEKELRSRPESRSRFYKDIEKYLELIRSSLLTNRKNLLHNPVVSPYWSEPRVYVRALELVKNNIPDDFPDTVKNKLAEHIDYLMSRILPKL